VNRVSFSLDERQAVLGYAVADLTQVLADLTDNAMRLSPPEAGAVGGGRRIQRAGACGVPGSSLRPDRSEVSDRARWRS
jgi:hypothetical protein